MSVKSVLAFLNSELYQYLYIKLFREIKILKGNLNQLPFPNLNKEEDKKLSKLTNDVIIKDDKDDKIQEYIYKFYKITEKEVNHIKKKLNETVN